MKFVLIVLLISICVLIGGKFYFKYKKRLLFFEALVYLCQKFDVEIAFSRQRVQNIITSLDEKLKNNLCGLDKNFLNCISSENLIEKENLFFDINFLTDDEKNTIFLFFKSLGRSDMENQLKEIKNFDSKFTAFQTQSNSDYKKYGKLSVKMSIIASLMIVVIFL